MVYYWYFSLEGFNPTHYCHPVTCGERMPNGMNVLADSDPQYKSGSVGITYTCSYKHTFTFQAAGVDNTHPSENIF